jgi:putative hemolysin
MLTLIFIIFVSMSISFLCSFLEASLLSLSNVTIAKISTKNQKIAGIWHNLKENIQKPIAVILIVNTLAHTIGAALSGAQFNMLYGTEWIFIFSVIYSFAIIQWSEILPKTLGVRYNETIAYFIAIPLKIMVNIFLPIVWIIELFNRPFIGRWLKDSKKGTIDEISILAKYAHLNKLISKDQEQIISRTIGLTSKKVKDIMIPAADMKVLRTSMTLTDALIQAHIHNHTRYPLIDEQNMVIGYVNFKDIISVLQINPTNPSILGIKRPVMSFYEQDNFQDVFKKMTVSHQHIAVIKSSTGEIKGLLTLEDIIEEIIGEIEDEYDVLPEHFYQIAENRYIIGSGLKIDQINSYLDINLPEPEKTLEKWIHNHFDKTLKPAERIHYENICFIIRKVRRRHIYEMIIEINR